MQRRVLLPMDGSEHADRALVWYAENMNRQSDELVFVYAVEMPTMSTAMLGSGQQPQHQQAAASSSLAGPGKRLSLNLQERCRQLGIRNRARFLEKVTPGPGQSIVETAQSEDTDLIIMGNRGMGSIRRTFLGSVSDHVLHHAHIPVIIVPPGKGNRKESASSSNN